MRTVRSRFLDYTIEGHSSPAAALAAVMKDERPHFLVDRAVYELLDPEVRASLPAERLVLMEATEVTKSYGSLEPVFLDLLDRGLRRNGLLVVVGGGVLQDAGCFIASVLARGIRWELVPTTLLAQADSCIGSKNSINIGSYKNQIGTFCPPHRVLLVPGFLRTLPFDEIRSGLGEVIKLQLLSGEQGFEELMGDLNGFSVPLTADRLSLLAKWVERSMDVKQPVIEIDEFDRGPRLLLNYGHTFGHAFESVTDFGIPHGIAVVLGILAATSVSVRLGLVPENHAAALARKLQPWHEPYAKRLLGFDIANLLAALARDKKNTAAGLSCILTRGFGHMERTSLSADQVKSGVVPALADLIQGEFKL